MCRVVWEAVVVAAAAAVAVVVVAAVVVVVVVAEDDMMIIPHHPPPIIGKYTLTLALVPHTPSLILVHPTHQQPSTGVKKRNHHQQRQYHPTHRRPFPR